MKTFKYVSDVFTTGGSFHFLKHNSVLTGQAVNDSYHITDTNIYIEKNCLIN